MALRKLVPVVLAGLLAAAGGRAAETPPFSEVIEVQELEIEVVATDREGAAVRDLTAADFRVFEDGVAVPLSHFSLVGPRRPGDARRVGPGAEPAETAAGIQVAIFLDEVHVGAASRRRLLADLADTLAQRLTGEDEVMLAVYNGSTRVVLPFGSDRKALRSALEGAEAPSTARMLVEQERMYTIQELYQDATGDHGWSPCLHIQEIVDRHSDQEYQRVRAAVRAFRRFVDSLSGIEGRKVVLHVSDGIPQFAGAEAARLAYELCSGTGTILGQAAKPPNRMSENLDIYGHEHHTMDANRYDTSALWQEVAAVANTGNISIYTIQAGIFEVASMTTSQGHRGSLSSWSQADQSANLQGTLFLLADQTGGRALLGGANDPASLAGLVDELRTHYLLAYTPPAANKTGARQIRVEVSRPGVDLRYRKAYLPRSPHHQVAQQLLGRLLDGEQQRTTGASLELGGTEPAGKQFKTRFALKVPFKDVALVESGDARQGQLSVFLAVSDEGGANTPVRHTAIPVTLSKTEPPAQDYLLWEIRVLLGPGRHRVAVAVRDDLDGEVDYLVRNFDLGRARGGEQSTR